MGVAETCFVPRGTRIDSRIFLAIFKDTISWEQRKYVCYPNQPSVISPFCQIVLFYLVRCPPLGVFHLGFKKSGYELITNVALYRGISPKLYCLVHPNLHLFINHICWSPHLLVHCQNSMKGKSSRNSIWNPHGFRTPTKTGHDGVNWWQ